jgi:hypothetical protein
MASTSDIKFPMGTQFLFETLLFTVGESGDLELTIQDQDERHATSIDVEFPHGIINVTSTLSMVRGSPSGPHLDADLSVGLYSSTALTA